EEAADDRAGFAGGRVVGVELEAARAPKHLAEDHLRLEAGQRRTDTQVDAPAEGDVVAWRRPIEDAPVGAVVLGRVTVGRAPQQQHGGTGGDLDATELGHPRGVPEVVPE